MNLEPQGPVQKFMDTEFIRITDPYVPFDEAGMYARPGRLRNSALTASVLGSGYVIYEAPYARRLYYADTYNFQGAPQRGAYWADRAIQEGGRLKLTREVQAFIDKRGKK